MAWLEVRADCWFGHVNGFIAATARSTAEDLAKNPDLAEDYKIHAFLAMTDDCEAVAVPLAGKGFMDMEKWPLVQASAMEVGADRC